MLKGGAYQQVQWFIAGKLKAEPGPWASGAALGRTARIAANLPEM